LRKSLSYKREKGGELYTPLPTTSESGYRNFSEMTNPNTTFFMSLESKINAIAAHADAIAARAEKIDEIAVRVEKLGSEIKEMTDSRIRSNNTQMCFLFLDLVKCVYPGTKFLKTQMMEIQKIAKFRDFEPFETNTLWSYASNLNDKKY
jgi:hypothetical protein